MAASAILHQPQAASLRFWASLVTGKGCLHQAASEGVNFPRSFSEPLNSLCPKVEAASELNNYR